VPTAVVAFADLVVGAIITGTAAVVGYQAAAVVLNIGIGLAAIAGLSKLTERLFGEDVPPTWNISASFTAKL
jgi:hypothetical protein